MVELQNKPIFVYYLALISIISVIIIIAQIVFPSVAFIGRLGIATPMIILGAGLIAESGVVGILMKLPEANRMEIFSHFITGIVGVAVLTTGIVLLPFFGVAIVGVLRTWVVSILIIKVFAIGLEVFLF